MILYPSRDETGGYETGRLGFYRLDVSPLLEIKNTV